MKKYFIGFLIFHFSFVTFIPSIASAAAYSTNPTYQQTFINLENSDSEQPQVSTFFWGWLFPIVINAAKWAVKQAINIVKKVVNGTATAVGYEAGKDIYEEGKKVIKN